MGKKDDALARARRALSTVDAELDPNRAYPDSLARARSDEPALPAGDDTGVPEVEILHHGQRPAVTPRRTRVWALAAALALLGGAGAGTVLLWPEPAGVIPGGTVPTAPAPDQPTTAPSTEPTPTPRECGVGVPTPHATPAGPLRPSDRPLSPAPCTSAPPGLP